MEQSEGLLNERRNAVAAVAGRFLLHEFAAVARLARGRCASVNAAILASIATDSTGNLPTADSAESITQSAPSRIAFATSVASARVGRRLLTIDSSIWVAVITGLPARFAPAISFFCVYAISSIGTSTPRSPRATMMPSAAPVLLVIPRQRVRALDLCNHKRRVPDSPGGLAQRLDIRGTLDERLAHSVHALAQRKLEAGPPTGKTN